MSVDAVWGGLVALVTLVVVPLAVYRMQDWHSQRSQGERSAKQDQEAAEARLSSITLLPMLDLRADAFKPVVVLVARGDADSMKLSPTYVWLVLQDTVVQLPPWVMPFGEGESLELPDNASGIGMALSTELTTQLQSQRAVRLVVAAADGSAIDGERTWFLKSVEFRWDEAFSQVKPVRAPASAGHRRWSDDDEISFTAVLKALGLTDVTDESMPLSAWNQAHATSTPVPAAPEARPLSEPEERDLRLAIQGGEGTPVTVAELARSLGRDEATVGGQVQELVQAGVARTVRGPSGGVLLDDVGDQAEAITDKLSEGARSLSALKADVALDHQELLRVLEVLTGQGTIVRLANGKYQLADGPTRSWWVEQSSEQMVQLAERVLEIAREIEPRLAANYASPGYIGVVVEGHAQPVLLLSPRRRWVNVRPRFGSSIDAGALVDEAGFTGRGKIQSDGSVGFRVTEDVLAQKEPELRSLLEKAIATRTKGPFPDKGADGASAPAPG